MAIYEFTEDFGLYKKGYRIDLTGRNGIPDFLKEHGSKVKEVKGEKAKEASLPAPQEPTETKK